MACNDYKLSRRAMMGATSASILGFSIRDLLAYSGADHEAKAEHVILSQVKMLYCYPHSNITGTLR